MSPSLSFESSSSWQLDSSFGWPTDALPAIASVRCSASPPSQFLATDLSRLVLFGLPFNLIHLRFDRLWWATKKGFLMPEKVVLSLHSSGHLSVTLPSAQTSQQSNIDKGRASELFYELQLQTIQNNCQFKVAN
jgi:hypothetical protein